MKKILFFMLCCIITACGGNKSFFTKETPPKTFIKTPRIAVPALGTLADHCIALLKNNFPKALFVTSDADLIVRFTKKERGYFTFTVETKQGNIIFVRSYIMLDLDKESYKDILKQSCEAFKLFYTKNNGTAQ